MHHAQVAVIGGGIIGSSIAAEMARRGKTVTLIDGGTKTETPATPRSFGWINAHSPQHAHHFQLRLDAMAAWRRLKQDQSALPIAPITAIDWDMAPEAMTTTQARYEDAGHATRLMSHQELEARFPDLNIGADQAIISDMDMVADPGSITAFFREQAWSRGVKSFENRKVVRLEETGPGTKILFSDGEQLNAETVVIAAGLGTPDLLASIGVLLPMNRRAGMLLRSNPQAQKLGVLISAPDIHCWQLPDGRILAGRNQAGRIDDGDLAGLNSDMARRLAAIAPALSLVVFENETIALRPEPADGMPVLGRIAGHSNILVAVLHSGITLAPVIAELLAEQLENKAPLERLAPYALERFDAREALAS
ncbi:MAG: FAD-binding oxidoreductase [Pseudomonadota bacterium]